MSLFKKIFLKNSKQNDYEQKELLLKNINAEISINKNNIVKSTSEIKKIKKWIAELIHDHFYVPGDYWYEELAHFNEIKSHKENLLIDESIISKSEELIIEYQSQIKYRETRIEFSKMTIVKYEESQQKILDLGSEQKKTEIIPEKPDTFLKHQNRLNELLQNPKNFNNEQTPQTQLENIIENVNELIENYEIEEEVKSFMQQLNNQFNIEMKNYDQNRLISEMEKLIEQYKRK